MMKAILTIYGCAGTQIIKEMGMRQTNCWKKNTGSNKLIKEQMVISRRNWIRNGKEK